MADAPGERTIVVVTGLPRSGTSLNIVGTVSGAGSLNLSGSGTLKLSAAAGNSCVGTTANGGMLIVSNTSRSATGSGTETMNCGPLSGGGIITGNVVAGSGAHTIAPSAAFSGSSTLKLTVCGLTTASNTTRAFKLVSRGTYDLTGPSPVNTAGNVNDGLVITASASLTFDGGTLSISNDPVNVGLGSLGFYKAIQYSGALNGSYTSIIPPGADSNKIVYTLDIARDAGFVDIQHGFLGDANDDGTINFAEFVSLSNSFCTAGEGWVGGDFNGDGITNFADFFQLSNNFVSNVNPWALVSSAENVAKFHAATANFGDFGAGTGQFVAGRGGLAGAAASQMKGKFTI